MKSPLNIGWPVGYTLKGESCMNDNDYVIETKNVTVKFHIRKGLKRLSFTAVDRVSISIPKGFIYGLIGESGSGKTTLGKVTLALIKPSSGEVLFRGKNIYKMDKMEFKQYRINAQYIPQDPYASLNPYKKVKDILMDIIHYHRMANSYKDALSMVIDTMAKVGLNPPEKYLERYPFQLSGGERQRVSIARALILKPAYVVADEPVTMLDASLKASIVKTIKDMIHDIKSSLLFITHEITLLQYFGSSTIVGVMYLGKLVEQASLKDLLESPFHPYTQALISAIPVADPKARETRKLMLTSITPSPLNKPPGCPLSNRCPFVMDICKKEEPPLKQIKPKHYVACYLN